MKTNEKTIPATYDAQPIRDFLLWAGNAHPARKLELTELINGYIVEREAAAAAVVA